MTYNQIITALKDIISDVTGVAVVYDEMPDQIESYPCVIIIPNGHEGSFLNLRDTRKTYAITLKVIAHLDGTKNASQGILRGLVDSVTQAVESQANITLGGKVDWVNPSKCRFDWGEDLSPKYIATIDISMAVRESRY